MNEWVFDKPYKRELSENGLTLVSTIEKKYVEKEEGGKIVLNYRNPFFELSGINTPETNCGILYRLDASKKETYSPNNDFLGNNTSGAKLRFKTDAKYVTVNLKHARSHGLMFHFPLSGAVGADLLAGSGTDLEFKGYISPWGMPYDGNTTVATIYLGEEKIKDVTIDLPLYGGVDNISIEFSENDRVALPTPFRYDAPICFYGSSITQGACVSKPSNCYMHILGRALEAETLNFGFSGSGLGEQNVADYVASKDMCAFILDYDHNAPTPDHLYKTHFNFYKTVRKAHPDIPIIMMSRPVFSREYSEEEKKRWQIVYESYKRGLGMGDQNLYFVDAKKFFPSFYRDFCTMDSIHPNDLGHMKMAEAVYPTLKSALEKSYPCK